MKKYLLAGVLATTCVFSPLYCEATPINVAGFGTASSSSGTAGMVIDGSYDTSLPLNGTDYWQLDLDRAYQIQRMSFVFAANKAYDFNISFRDGAKKSVWNFSGEFANTSRTLLPALDFMVSSIRFDSQKKGPFTLYEVNVMAEPVPEPSTMLLLVAGLGGLAVIRKKCQPNST